MRAHLPRPLSRSRRPRRRADARRSLQRLASLTKLTWRDRIKNAERKAGKAFMTARLFMRAGGETVMSEHPPVSSLLHLPESRPYSSPCIN